MIDTHTHLYDPAFDADRVEVIRRALGAGVSQMLLPNINGDTIGPMLELCRRCPGICYPMLGLHPEDVRDDYRDRLDEMEPMLQAEDHPFVAVGEVGIDLYWDKTYRAQQLDAFERQIQWAIDYRLPLMIHTRSAHAEMLDAMRRHAQDHLTGVFHCFSGSREMASELLAFPGFMLGIGGVVTYKKSRLPEVLAASVPLSRIVLETDSPYLAPVPHRGERNESAYVNDVAQQLAYIYNVSVYDVRYVTAVNAKRVFPRLNPSKGGE